jgi:hypothetical protein
VGVAASAAALSAAPVEVPDAIVRRNDEAVDRLLKQQVTDPASPWRGALPDQYGLHMANSGGGVINYAGASYLSPKSRFHRDPRAKNAIRLAAEFLQRSQSPDGNIDLETTNFNSPPDTGFVVWNVAEIASAARRLRDPEIEAILKPFLMNAARGMTKGGVHTPNHRWVICSALAQIHALWPDPAYVRRIDQWLAEGIDIDEDGQWDERSTTIYNTVSNRAFVLMAAKLGRPQLLDPVRKNLDSMLYLLHPGYEVVTEISRRQDLNQRGNMGRYWYALATLARLDKNGQYQTLAKHFEADYASLGTVLDQPELLEAGPAPAPLPDNYLKTYKTIPLIRVRRGLTSASILTEGTSRFFAFRRGSAVVEAMRFASAFFGKAQFIPSRWERQGDSYVLTQDLEGPYWQPLSPPAPVHAGEWGFSRSKRATSEVAKLRQTATITETPNGFRVRLQSLGTDRVPVAVEIGLRQGGELRGCDKIGDQAWLLRDKEAVFTHEGHRIRFGPGLAVHQWVQVRGAQEKLPHDSVYLTGITPFDHTIEFHLS